MLYTSNKYADQPTYMHSLIKASVQYITVYALIVCTGIVLKAWSDYIYTYPKKKISSFPIKILENAVQYFLKLSMIMVCETSDFNIRKHGH